MPRPAVRRRGLGDDPAVAVPPELRLDVLRLRAEAGAPLHDTGDLPTRVQRAVRVATAVGAPVLAALDAAQAAEDDARRAARAVLVASAQARAVAAGLVLAPVVLVPGLGRLAGIDLVAFYAQPLGLLVLALGAVLLAVGWCGVVLLVRRVGTATRPSPPADRRATLVGIGVALMAWWLVGLAAAPVAFAASRWLARRRAGSCAPAVGVDEAADLAAVALCGGVGAAEALRCAAAELPALAGRLHRLAFSLELGMRGDDLAGHAPRKAAVAWRSRGVPSGRGTAKAATDPLLRVAILVAAADEVGAPLAPTLRRLARELRADDLARVLAAAERLPAQLTFPTALALLPATVLLVGAPIMHAGLAGLGL